MTYGTLVGLHRYERLRIGTDVPASVPGRILAVAIAGGFALVLCEAMLEKISAALRYPKVRKRIALSGDELDRYGHSLRSMAR